MVEHLGVCVEFYLFIFVEEEQLRGPKRQSEMSLPRHFLVVLSGTLFNYSRGKQKAFSESFG